MANNFLFVDGSALLGDIRRARITLALDENSVLDLRAFVKYFTGVHFREYLEGGYRRFVFYFVQDDDRLRSFVRLPNFSNPGEVSDIRIEYCGKRIREFQQARDWLDKHNAPQHVQDCLYRTEKAVDTQICCDALQLAATGKLDRLFLYTNDFDFMPLCKSLRQLGANINLFRLHSADVNAELVAQCDAFHVMGEGMLRGCLKAPDV